MIELTFKGNSLTEVFESMREALGSSEKVADNTSQEVKAETKEETPTLTLAEVKKLAKAKLDEGKSGEVKGLLAEMGLKKVGDLQEEQFAEFTKGLEAL
ncbi:hypothetical protein [Streptococcus pluranimalium]|uniref:hypothetical protein n=1 Tax=Streptococcus pluranimalium TaxID=82348 RepID=UPI003F6903A0